MKKIVSLILAAALAVPALSGCGKTNSTAKFNENGEFIPEHELSLTIWDTQNTDRVTVDTSDESIPRDWLYNKTKVKIGTIYGNDGGQWDTKLSRLIASDTMPDILYVAGGQGATHFKKLKTAGKLYELTPEMLQKYAPNLWSRVPEACWAALTDDGKIMGIPYGFPDATEQIYPGATEKQLEVIHEVAYDPITDFRSLFIRDDILKKMYPNAKSWDEICKLSDEKQDRIGEELYDIPVNSTQDFIDMMYNIKDMNLTSEGQKVYALGYDGADLWFPFETFGGQMYGYIRNAYFSAWNAKEKKITIPLVEENGLVKQAAKTQNQMIRDGVIDPESLVQTSAAFKENCLKGTYAILSTAYYGSLQKLNNDLEKLGKSFRYRPLYTNVPQSDEYIMQANIKPWTGAVCLLNTLNEAEAIQTLNWINTMFSDEFEEILWWGTPEDGLYTEDADGVRTYTDDRFNRYYIDKEEGALTVKDCKGIGSLINAQYGEFYILPGFYIGKSRWNPEVMRGKIKYTSQSGNSYVCKYDKPGLKKCPPSDVFDPIYADIDEAVEYWAKREQWESGFKTAIAARSEEDFESKWTEAVNTLESIVDVDQLTEKMTKAALEDAKTNGYLDE